jgi:hypothetical protein
VFQKFLPKKILDLLVSDFLGNKFETTRHVSMTLPVTLLRGWRPLIDLMCPYDSASNPARGLGAAY